MCGKTYVDLLRESREVVVLERLREFLLLRGLEHCSGKRKTYRVLPPCDKGV